MAQKENSYFGILIELMKHSIRAANLLKNTLVNFDISQLENNIEKINKITKSADEKKQAMFKKLDKEFITPIAREDIIQLAFEINNITYSIKYILERIYMFNISYMKKEGEEFTNIILHYTNELKKVIEDFRNYKKPKSIYLLIRKINKLRDEGDNYYKLSVKKLFVYTRDPIRLMIWKDIFKEFHNCCNKIVLVSNLVENIILKNS